MFLWEWSIAKPYKRSPINVDLTQVLSLCKAENERSQHTDVTGRTINNLKIAYEYSDKGRCLQDLVQIAAQVYFDEQDYHQL